MKRFFPSPSVNLSYRRSLAALADELLQFGSAVLLVVGSGSQRTEIEKLFAQYPTIERVYCDVDSAAEVDFFCDVHELPVEDDACDGIICTAVLEHVLYPERAVAELSRVLRDGGLLYSEIPFLQQVHEGAYDFTRYTLSGHRRLCNQFQEISSGLVAGPGTALLWAIEGFALALTRGRFRSAVKALSRLPFLWLKYFDYFFQDNPQALDSACCTYFLGRKVAGTVVSDLAIIQRYSGSQQASNARRLKLRSDAKAQSRNSLDA